MVEQAGLLWTVLHSVIDRYRVEHPEWIVLRHEDISRQPELEYRRLAGRLGLQYHGAMAEFVGRTTLAESASDVPPGVAHRLQRYSASNVWTWKTRLSAREVATVRELTEPVAHRFYSDEEW